MPADVEVWLQRARIRLAPERTGLVLEDVVAVPAPADLGALGGFGGMATDRDLRVSAYVFEEWAGGSEAMEGLEAQAAAAGREFLAIVSGSILYVATAGPADRDRAALFDLSSSLSGPP